MKIILFTLTIFSYAFAEDGHDHAHEKKPAINVGQCGAGQTNCDSKSDHEDDGHNHGDENKDEHKDDHAHKDNEKEHNHGAEEEKDDHAHGANEKEHAHGEGEHGDEHGEEENAAIGPDKGILAKGPDGFKLSPEATKFFAYKTSEINGQTMTIPRSALVQVKDEKFVYRVRDGWIKRLGIRILIKQPHSLTVEFKEFSPKDSIIVSGTGYIRTTEIVVEEGVSHGHSH